MKYADVVNLIGQRVEVTNKQGKAVRGKLVWAHITCIKLDDGQTFFLDDLASVTTVLE